MFIKILGHKYRFGMMPLVDLGGTNGEVWTKRHTIFVAEEIPLSAKVDALLHEIIEAFDHLLDLGLTHQTISSLGECLTQTLKESGMLDPGFLRILSQGSARREEDLAEYDQRNYPGD